VSRPAPIPPGPVDSPGPRLLIDVTRTLQSGLHSGIQRVVRGLYRGARAAGSGPRAVAVRWAGDRWYALPELPPHPLELPGTVRLIARASNQPPRRLCPRQGDTLLLADASWYGDPWPAVRALLRAGGELTGFVHDLLPLQHPGWFRPGVGERFENHLHALRADGTRLFTPSQHVRGQLLALPGPAASVQCLRPANSLPFPERFPGTVPLMPPALSQLRPRRFFLSVATLEPRKEHGLLLNAFERYWQSGGDAALVLAGAAGWCNDALLARVRGHRELGRRLHWLQQTDDRQLAALYRDARALVYLSRAEGFGLPVLEARELGCPVIASDLPPLREAGGAWPRYLPGAAPGALLAALRAPPQRPAAGAVPPRDWAQVAGELIAALNATPLHRVHAGEIATP